MKVILWIYQCVFKRGEMTTDHARAIRLEMKKENEFGTVCHLRCIGFSMYNARSLEKIYEKF